MPTYRTAAPAALLAAAVLVTSACTAEDGSPDGERGAPPAGGSALAAVDTLTVKGRAPRTGYAREEFGRAWTDVDRNGCGTRVISMVRAVVGLFSQRMQGVVACA
ncbi:hypothetical protein [Streptomyces purpureus]|uniref:hypothetical protein n=1 Tax=Streptomyces purpureus TaxID=1951 RepID=UPI0003715171